jgi:hypothetical protein
MKDFRVVHAKILLKVLSVSPMREFFPPAIAITGEKLDLAEEIYFNGSEVKEFYVQSPNKMLIRIPDAQIGKNLRELRVLTSTQLAKQDALVVLGLTKTPKPVSGIDRLVQSWVLVFLSNPGSDIFNPNSGGGARSIIGTVQVQASPAADLALAVDRTRVELISSQANNPRIPTDERLLSATLSSVEYNELTTALSAVVEIKNSVGDRAEVSIG